MREEEGYKTEAARKMERKSFPRTAAPSQRSSQRPSVFGKVWKGLETNPDPLAEGLKSRSEEASTGSTFGDERCSTDSRLVNDYVFEFHAGELQARAVLKSSSEL